MDIGECRLRRVTTPEDEYLVVERADQHVYVADEVLEHLDERFAHFGDGIFTIHARDGDVSYGLSQYDPCLCRWLGTRST